LQPRMLLMTGAQPDRHDLLALAIGVATEAGAMLAGRRGRPSVIGTKTSPTDVVTEMDQAAERLIRTRILAARPQDAMLRGESGQTGGDAQVRWVVDPLDGTVNYLYGLPDWAVSIAAEVAGEVVAGVVCVPKRGVLFGAVAGAGSWQSGLGSAGARKRLTCTADVPLARALIGTGFGYERNRRVVQGQVLSAVLP